MVSCFGVGDPSEVSKALAALLQAQLQKGKRVVWLISGGSSIPVAVAASHLLKNADTKSLFVTLVDDKYGVPEPQTNFAQLLAQGFLAGNAQLQGILQPGLSLAKTGEQFNTLLTDRLAWADVAIGQFGLGEGYHTGGIMANSPASRAKQKLAIAYKYPGQGKVTITPVLIARLNIAFINSMGQAKRPLVQHFLQSKSSINAEPTQSLKTAKKTLLYSDVL